MSEWMGRWVDSRWLGGWVGCGWAGIPVPISFLSAGAAACQYLVVNSGICGADAHSITRLLESWLSESLCTRVFGFFCLASLRCGIGLWGVTCSTHFPDSPNGLSSPLIHLIMYLHNIQTFRVG